MVDTLGNVYCLDEARRAAVREHPTLNGIDFVEYHEDRAASLSQFRLAVTFLKEVGLVDLIGHPEQVRIQGGTRITGIEVVDVLAGDAAGQLTILLDRSGDFSPYVVSIAGAGLDEQLAHAAFSFKSECPTGFDCRHETACPPEPLAEPLLDYMAKDYASFRQLLLDLIPQRNPRWLERNPADFGMALVELLAYAGDYLSYYQDAVANEAYLDTCRLRVSAKRHTRLIDYQMHDGRNAWGYVQIDVASPGAVPRGTMLMTRIRRPLQGQPVRPGTVLDAGALPADFAADPALRDVTVFETTATVVTDPRNNLLYLHTWSNHECCLPTGAGGAVLYGVDEHTQVAYLPPLQSGDYLLLEEVKSASTGLAADADPAHRQVVRLATVQPIEDAVYRNQLVDGALQPVTALGERALPLLQVTWDSAFALTFPLCLSARSPRIGESRNISIARGNVIPCDHGRTIREELSLHSTGSLNRLSALRLSAGPLTFQAMPAERPAFEQLTAGLPTPAADRHDLDTPARAVKPAAVIQLVFPAGESEFWVPVPSLLDSNPLDRHFVVDVGNEGEATLRFGDDQYGRNPLGATAATALYRIGNGQAGNLGSGALCHLVHPLGVADWPDIREMRQPLAAEGGVDPESIEEVRQLAPAAFQAEQFRAVTAADYEAAALKLDGIAAAKATFRWTGSWHTVFVAVHPADPAELVADGGGRTRLSDRFVRAVRGHLTRYKLAGCDLEIRPAQYVPLQIALQVCVALGHFRGDVVQAVRRSLSNQRFAGGATGFFHPSAFAFGKSLYLSQLYAAVENVVGVESAVVTVFKRYWESANNELQQGVLPMGPGEIARLDNDPNFQEHGVLTITAVGGL